MCSTAITKSLGWGVREVLPEAGRPALMRVAIVPARHENEAWFAGIKVVFLVRREFVDLDGPG